MRSSRSYTATVCPALASCCAAANPAGPEPITATVFPERRSGLGDNPPLIPGFVNDGNFDLLDGYRISINPKNTGGFTRCGAKAPGEFGEVISRM